MADPSAIGGLEPTYREIDGVETRFYRAGSGRPVVMLHGGPWGSALSANNWSRNIELLARDFEVFALDRLGCGLTESPESASEFVYESEVGHVEAFLAEFGLEDCVLVGSSRGAGLAGAVAVANRDWVDALIACNTGTLGYKLGPDVLHRREKIFEDVETLDLKPRDELEHFLRKYCYEYDHLTSEYLDAGVSIDASDRSTRTAELLTEAAFEGYEETLHAAQRETQEAMKFGNYDIPTLLYWGRNDPTAVLEQGLHLYDLVAQGDADAKLTVVDDCGHFPHRERTASFNADVRSFVASLE